MSDDSSRKRLGKGLAALIGELDAPAANKRGGESANAALVETKSAFGSVDQPIGQISPNPANPRRQFRDEELSDLADSIRAHGVVQPVIVRPAPGRPGSYELIAGERRWRGL
jgi:ParB family transcriptional regulator, chromosome partitioning protein